MEQVADFAKGSVTGGGEYAYGTSATIEAVPAVIPVPSAGMYVVMVEEEMVKVVVR